MSERIIPTMWGKRARISRNWATVMVGLGTVLVLVGVSLSLLMCNKKRRVCSEAQGLVEYDLCAILGLFSSNWFSLHPMALSCFYRLCLFVQVSATFIAVDTFLLLKAVFSRLPPSSAIHGSCLSHFTKLRPAQGLVFVTCLNK